MISCQNNVDDTIIDNSFDGQIENNIGSDTANSNTETILYTKKLAENEDEVLSNLNEFSFDLFNLIHESECSSDEVVVSPLSAYIALAMTANGANGDTLTAFENVLGASVEDLNKTAKNIISSLSDTSKDTALEIANSIWSSKNNLEPNKEFTKTISKYYSADFYSVDFLDKKTVKLANDWVKEKTHKLIPSIVKEFDPNTVMMLMNALYMNAKWLSPFDSNSTSESKFNNYDGSVSSIDFMNKYESYERYLNDGISESLILNYTDQDLKMMIIKPESYDDFTFSYDYFNKIRSDAKTECINLSMPKLSCSCSVKMNEVLSDMGLEVAFYPLSADLSGLGKSYGNIYISQVLQKVQLNITEEGTEAAAVTAVTCAAESVGPIPIKVSIDSPYYIVVFDSGNGVPIFIGTFKNM